jgi:hypothetical protein
VAEPELEVSENKFYRKKRIPERGAGKPREK